MCSLLRYRNPNGSCTVSFANSFMFTACRFWSLFVVAALAPQLYAVAEPPVARAEPVTQRDVTTRAQIFLDQQLFGPGKIDGLPGEFLSKALKRYQRAHNLPETGVIDSRIPLDSVFPVYSTYTITEDDLKFV